MKFILKSLQNIDNLMSFIFSNNANEKEYLIKNLKIRNLFVLMWGQILGVFRLFSKKFYI